MYSFPLPCTTRTEKNFAEVTLNGAHCRNFIPRFSVFFLLEGMHSTGENQGCKTDAARSPRFRKTPVSFCSPLFTAQMQYLDGPHSRQAERVEALGVGARRSLCCLPASPSWMTSWPLRWRRGTLRRTAPKQVLHVVLILKPHHHGFCFTVIRG